MLTTLISVIAIIWSWDTVNTRTREYYIAMLLLETGMLGVFVSLDLFLFYIFWELMLIPMALLIGIWGSTNRVYAAVKFFLYTLSRLAPDAGRHRRHLLGVLSGDRHPHPQRSRSSQRATYGREFQIWVFLAFFIAFAVKVPMFPFHTWLPDAHVEAPTAASVILAAVMLKMGGYGLLRFNLPLFPEATRFWQPWIVASLGHRHSLRRLRRPRPARHEEADRLLLGQPHGLRDARHRSSSTSRAWTARCW